jgi:hypothetical protein
MQCGRKTGYHDSIFTDLTGVFGENGRVLMPTQEAELKIKNEMKWH